MINSGFVRFVWKIKNTQEDSPKGKNRDILQIEVVVVIYILNGVFNELSIAIYLCF